MLPKAIYVLNLRIYYYVFIFSGRKIQLLIFFLKVIEANKKGLRFYHTFILILVKKKS